MSLAAKWCCSGNSERLHIFCELSCFLKRAGWVFYRFLLPSIFLIRAIKSCTLFLLLLSSLLLLFTVYLPDVFLLSAAVSASFMNGVTSITWNDQMGAEGEVYHVYRSVGTRLTSASNLTLEAELVATVPDGVQSASYSVLSLIHI